MIPAGARSPSVELAPLTDEDGGPGQGARELDRDTAQRLFGAMLDGSVPPHQFEAVLVAHRAEAETVDALIGFMTALEQGLERLEAPGDRPRPVVLPTYSGSRRLPNLTALLALLLRRYRVPVLLHGMAEAANHFGRITTAAVLRELGIQPAASVLEARRSVASDGLAFLPIELLAPGLAALLRLRQRARLASRAHMLARLIDPFGGSGLRVIAVAPSEATGARAFLSATHADALLLCGTEGEPFANPRRQPQLEWFAYGEGTVLFEAEAGTPKPQPALPRALDVAATAAWTAAALAGEVPIPQPILNQLACCLHATRQPPGAA